MKGEVQKNVPTSMQPRILYILHYPKLAGPPGERRMYDSMRCEFYLLHMANYAYVVVKDFCD